MRFRLRTLLIVLALAPPLMAGSYWICKSLLPPLPPPWYIQDRQNNFPPGPAFKLMLREQAEIKRAQANRTAGSTDNRP
jgi:hypothetical protein